MKTKYDMNDHVDLTENDLNKLNQPVIDFHSMLSYEDYMRRTITRSKLRMVYSNRSLFHIYMMRHSICFTRLNV